MEEIMKWKKYGRQVVEKNPHSHRKFALWNREHL